jgi:hypothetical protein
MTGRKALNSFITAIEQGWLRQTKNLRTLGLKLERETANHATA